VGETIADAQARVYEAVELIDFDRAYCRRDIAAKALT
jgi:phosphoribosylamine-glycine ligase